MREPPSSELHPYAKQITPPRREQIISASVHVGDCMQDVYMFRCFPITAEPEMRPKGVALVSQWLPAPVKSGSSVYRDAERLHRDIRLLASRGRRPAASIPMARRAGTQISRKSRLFITPPQGYRSKIPSEACPASANDYSRALLAENASFLGSGAVITTLLALQETKHTPRALALAISCRVGVCWQSRILAG